MNKENWEETEALQGKDELEVQEEKKANIFWWKLLLLGSNTEHSLDLSEVCFPLYSS